MANTISVNTKTINLILVRLDTMAKDIHTLKEKLLDQEPPYGSEAWWEWSDKRGLKDIKEARYTTVHNKKELGKLLNSLKTQ